MVASIIGIITSAIGDLAESFAGSFVDTFTALFVDTTGTTPAVSMYGTWALCGVGIGFCIAIIRTLTRKKSGL